jgi:hypothetical protein
MSRLWVYRRPLTFSDIADDAAGDGIRSDPDSLFDALFTDCTTGVLDCQELLWQEDLQRTARRVSPQETARDPNAVGMRS